MKELLGRVVVVVAGPMFLPDEDADWYYSVDATWVREQSVGKCSYCDRSGRSYTVAEMADRIDTVFGQHYRRTPDEPDSFQQAMLSDRESSSVWDRDGEPVVDAIQCILEERYGDRHADEVGEETDFASDSYYEEKAASDWAWQEEWREFERSLKTEARFFSRFAAKHLASVFGRIDEMALV